MNEKWMPITAGVLDIIGGILGPRLVASALFIHAIDIGAFDTFDTLDAYVTYGNIVFSLSFACMALAIVSGAFAFIRKKWSLALAGAIAALFPPILTMVYWNLDPHLFLAEALYLTIFIGAAAITAIILTILSKKQFERK